MFSIIVARTSFMKKLQELLRRFESLDNVASFMKKLQELLEGLSH